MPEDNRSEEARGGERRGGHTYGVSSMILHTLAMVPKQSVVFSIGKFLFCSEQKIVLLNLHPTEIRVVNLARDPVKYCGMTARWSAGKSTGGPPA